MNPLVTARPLEPIVREPVFNIVPAVATVPLPLKATLYPWFAVVRVVMATAPVNVIVPVVAVRVTVAALTARLNVVPPEFVMVRARSGCVPPTIPLKPTAPVEFTANVPTLSEAPSTVLLKVTVLVLVRVRVEPDPMVRAPIEIVPEPVPIEDVPLVVVVPREIALLVEVRAPLTAVDPAV